MFCKFCGKELQDGEVCGCAGSQQAAAAQAQQTSGAAQAATDQMSGQVNAGQADAAGAQGTQFNTAQMQQKANEYMQQGMEAAGNAWKNLLGIFKSPAQEGRAPACREEPLKIYAPLPSTARRSVSRPELFSASPYPGTCR
jgi:hypothetical protein